MGVRWNAGAAAVAAVLFTVELFLFLYVRGPVRSWFGDLLVVVLQVALLAAAGIGTARQRILGVGALALGTELLQGLGLVGPGSHWILHLLFGSTLDPLDLLAYALGLAIAVPLERSWAPEL